MEGKITADEAATKLDYKYDNFLRLVREGRVHGAEYWQGYMIPADISREDIATRQRKIF